MVSFAALMLFPWAPSLGSMPLTQEHADVSPAMQEFVSHHVVAVATVTWMVLPATATVLQSLPPF